MKIPIQQFVHEASAVPPPTSELCGIRDGFKVHSRDPVSGNWLVATLCSEESGRKRLAFTIGDANTSMTTTYQGLTLEQCIYLSKLFGKAGEL